MQIKTTMKYYFISIRMAIIKKKKTKNNKGFHRSGQTGIIAYHQWERKMVQPTEENIMAVP